MPLQSAFANAAAIPPQMGTPYCINHVMPAAEGDLSDQPPYVGDPVNLIWEYAVAAEVTFTQQGSPVALSGACYVVAQIDAGDGNWVDACWCTLTALPGAIPVTFWLSLGLDATNGSFQQTRTPGTAPSPNNGSNAVALGARIRFVGKGAVSASSSSSSSSSSGQPGLPNAILVTIRWRPITPR